jgi:alanine racemase
MAELAEARLLVDLDALARNHARLRAMAGGAEVAPVVKADGYGLGAAEVARRLYADGARRFFVARLSEGEALRAALSTREAVIYVLDGCPPGAADRLDAAALIPVLNTLDQLADWARGAPRVGRPAALHVDTGMNRLGLPIEEAHALAASSDRLGRLDVTLVMSHLACAEDAGSPMNRAQLARFREARALFPQARASLANSAGVALGPEFGFDMVRPGIGLYGGCGSEPVLTWEAPILQLRTVRPGESVGYGASFTARETLRTATVAAGYADGALRALSGRGYGTLDGRPCPILGRVSMDLLVVDVSGAPGARVGDPVTLLGDDPPLDAVAEAAGTLGYEILVRLGARTPRTYRGARG